MSNFIRNYLDTYFDQIEPIEFYKQIFSKRDLAIKGQQETGMYNGIALELLPVAEDQINAKRYLITQDLEVFNELLKSDNFIIVSPISYIGMSRRSANARYIYAIAIDLDGIKELHNLTDLFYQIKNEVLPKPTYIVSSGTGLHLYYLLDQPIPCYSDNILLLSDMKKELTRMIWNRYTTAYHDKPQFESLFQGFRLVGGITKAGDRTKAYVTGDIVSIDYLNKFVEPVFQFRKHLKSRDKKHLSLDKAKVKFPEWYEKRIIQDQKKGHWICDEALYYWWLNRIKNESKVGHRYFCAMVLAIYAKKCGISREQLESDAFNLVPVFDIKTDSEDNHFTREDILSALEMYNDDYFTFPIDSIVNLTNISIEKNKRNYRKQADHLKLMRFIRDEINGNKDWQNKNGRPTKEQEVKEWRAMNPDGKKAECNRQTGISRPTIDKYWNS